MRRLNNARGHLQFRYESKKQTKLRNYLVSIFGATVDQPNAVLRVTEVQSGVFRFHPVLAGRDNIVSLSFCRPHFHNCSREEVSEFCEFKELERCLLGIPYHEQHNQTEYNKQIAATLTQMGWSGETRIIDEMGLRCDFEKNDIWVEVEFGNARVYYQDYIKFLLAVHYKSSRLGVLLCPTNAFAQLLCDLGQRRAMARRNDSTKRRPSYSGMMSYEKAMRELPFLQFLLTCGVVIDGIDISG